jgi:hypothetical protein
MAYDKNPRNLRTIDASKTIALKRRIAVDLPSHCKARPFSLIFIMKLPKDTETAEIVDFHCPFQSPIFSRGVISL